MTCPIETTKKHLFVINHQSIDRIVGGAKKCKGFCSSRDGQSRSDHSAINKESYQLFGVCMSNAQKTGLYSGLQCSSFLPIRNFIPPMILQTHQKKMIILRDLFAIYPTIPVPKIDVAQICFNFGRYLSYLCEKRSDLMRASEGCHKDRGDRKRLQGLRQSKCLLLSDLVMHRIPTTIRHWKGHALNAGLTFAVQDQQKFSSAFRGVLNMLSIYFSHCLSTSFLSKTLETDMPVGWKNCVFGNPQGAL